MKNFTCVQDIGNLKSALDEAFEIKKDRFKYVELGRNKTLMMIFFNSSLRTRLSTQKAALNLGMNVIVLDINQGAWKLETERGVIMDGDKPEHLLEAIPVMGCYCDIIGVRSFARFENREYDYNEVILNQFIKHSGRPVFSMEAATRHPLHFFAALIIKFQTYNSPIPLGNLCLSGLQVTACENNLAAFILELQHSGTAQHSNSLFRILYARQLNNNTVLALTLNNRLGQAQLIYTTLNNLYTAVDSVIVNLKFRRIHSL